MKKFVEVWKRIDLFGEPIKLTFKGAGKFRSITGALISTLCLTMMCAFFVMRTEKFISRDDPLLT